MSDGLSLEKLKIHERLEKVEAHMIEATEVKKAMIIDLSRLNESVEKLEHITYGNGDKGIVHKVNDLCKAAENIQGVLKRIFWIILSALLLTALPKVTEALHYLTHQK